MQEKLILINKIKNINQFSLKPKNTVYFHERPKNEKNIIERNFDDKLFYIKSSQPTR